MNVQTTAYQPVIDANTIIVLLALVLFGLAYAALVRQMRRRHPNHGYTAILVVGGNLIIALGYSVLAGLLEGILLLACMAAAGLPMVVEYVESHLSSQSKLDI